MSKKVNFVFDWLGPTRPLPNNHSPSIAELVSASGHASMVRSSHELVFEETYPPVYFNLRQLDLARTHSTSHLPTESFVYEYEHYWWHFDHFFNSFIAGGFLDWGAKPQAVWQRLREKTAYLLISIPMESWISFDKLQQLDNYISYADLPKSQIVYVTCSPNGKEQYEKYCASKNITPEINLEHIPHYFLIYRNQCQNRSVEYNVGPKEKTFLMFNRRWHPQRALLLAHAYKNNLLDKFYMSFSKKEVDSDRSYTSYIKNYGFDCLNVDNPITDQDVEQIDGLLPLVLDQENLKQDLMFTEFDDTARFYNNSLVHIIAETNFFSDIIHLTEKSYKPIFYKQPFIMLSSPGSLRALKEQGFKTFDKLWNESYDDEKDHTKRFFMILDIIKEISAWNEMQKLHASRVAKYIVDYNYEVLKNGKVPFVDQFVERYGA